MTLSINELQRRFPVQGVQFELGNGGLPRVVIQNDLVTGELYLHGAHVTRFQPTGHAPVLWMSRESHFDTSKPIRGGVPICFPWFGPHASDANQPSHGWARLTEWNVVGCGYVADGGISLDLETKVTDFKLSFRVCWGQSLRMELAVQLLPGSIATRRFEEALHSYFHVSDIQQVSVSGLEHTAYIDKVGEPTRRDASREPIRFVEETDRVYGDTVATCVLHDPKLDRKITVKKWGSRSTVVWNPWIAKSTKMADFGDDEWTGMVCIETANVGAHAIELAPGQHHTLVTEIVVNAIKDA